MNNAVYGKFLENCRRYRDIRLVTRWESRYGAKSLISRPNFHNCNVIDENLAVIELNKTSILFNKPIYVGFTILDLAKAHLYDFQYNFIKKNFNTNARLMYTDTDSLIYNFINLDIYEIIKQNVHLFDT